MITTPNTGNYSNNLSLAESQSNTLPSWLSFDSSTAEITSTDPDTVSSDLYTITNTLTSVFFALPFTLTNDLNITVIESTGNTTNNSKNDDDHCFDTSSEAVCAIIITAIIIGGLIPFIILAGIIYCKCKKARNNSDRTCVQADDNQDNQEHHSIQQQDHQPVQAQDVELETETRGFNGVYQTSDNQI